MGSRQETRWLRCSPCRGNQPLLRTAPVQRVSWRDQGDPEWPESALTGLYKGVALPDQSQFDHAALPPVITLFRQPLLQEMEDTGVSFTALVRHVVIHEVGHHFGLSDDDMHALEDSVED